MLKLVAFLSILILATSCQGVVMPPELPSRKVALVYMVADNNLDYFAQGDINEMELGFPENSKDKLFVYIDRAKGKTPSHPYLLEIKHDKTDKIVSKIIKSYPEVNSANAQNLDNVLSEVFTSSEYAISSKSLILWSHGNAWLPEGFSLLSGKNTSQAKTKSFAEDNTPKNTNMDIKDLGKTLEGYRFDFLAFDACFMNAIEVIYQLRHSTKYLMASSTEILAEGFPYQTIVPLLFDGSYTEVAQNFFDYYNAKTGHSKSASIALINLREIDKLTENINSLMTAFSSKDNFQLADKKQIQQLDRLDGNWIYDLKDFLSANAKINNLENEYQSIKNQWSHTVVYNAHTQKIVNLNLSNVNGMSTYIPNSSQDGKANKYYKTLPWFTASGYSKVFTNF